MSGGRSPTGKNDAEERFEAIFRSTYSSVLAYAIRRSAERGAAEEAAAETFLIAWRRLEDVPKPALPWLLGTTRRVLANQRRAAGRRLSTTAEHLAGPAPDPSSGTAEVITERDAFVRAFARLAERDREVLSLIAWEGLQVREAAGVMGCSATAFSIRLHRARRRLLKELQASGHSLGERQTGSTFGRRPRTTEEP